MKQRWKLSLASVLCCAMLLPSTSAFYFDGPSSWARVEVRAALDSYFLNWETAMSSTAWLEPPSDQSYQMPISRIDFCSLVSHLLGLDQNRVSYDLWLSAQKDGHTSPFEDLNRVFGNYSGMLCHYYGIIDGVSETKFDPFGNLTREQAAKILAKTVEVLRPELWDEGKDYLADKAVTDKEKISSWAGNYVGFVLDQGIMSGVGDGAFAPQDPYTMEQALLTCYRLGKQLQVPGMIPVEQAATWLDDYRMNRYLIYFEDSGNPKIRLYYGGFADGISKMTVEKWLITGEGIDKTPLSIYVPNKDDAHPDFLLSLNAFSPILEHGVYYSAEVRLTLHMKNGTKQKLTDCFVFTY